MSTTLDPDTPVHRIGGSEVENLRLNEKEETLEPPGISVLIGGSPQDATDQMRRAFPVATRLHALASTVGSTTPKLIRAAGFDIIEDATRKFPNHGRVTHPEGTGGFDDANLAVLSDAFTDTYGH